MARSGWDGGLEWSRRGLLAALGAAALTSTASACGGGSSAAGNRGQKATAATYIPDSYQDLYPPMVRFLDDVTEFSRRRMRFDWYPAEVLLAAEQLMPGLVQGNTDFAFTTSSYISSSYPLLSAMELPFATDSLQHLKRAMDPDSDLFQMVNRQLGSYGLTLVATLPASFQAIWTVDRPVKAPDDLRGLRVRVAGHIEALTIQAFGGAPTSMSSAEIFEALQRGTIDGLMSYPGTIIGRTLQDVVKYGSMAPFGHYALAMFVRKDWWDALPDGLRTPVLRAAANYHNGGTAHLVKVHEEEYLPMIEKAGVRLTQLDSETLRSFRKAVEPVYSEWRASVGDAALADRALALVQKPLG